MSDNTKSPKPAPKTKSEHPYAEPEKLAQLKEISKRGLQALVELRKIRRETVH
jgi:hypothetical protein